MITAAAASQTVTFRNLGGNWLAYARAYLPAHAEISMFAGIRGMIPHQLNVNGSITRMPPLITTQTLSTFASRGS